LKRLMSNEHMRYVCWHGVFFLSLQEYLMRSLRRHSKKHKGLVAPADHSATNHGYGTEIISDLSKIL
jgi:hypothetical protein